MGRSRSTAHWALALLTLLLVAVGCSDEDDGERSLSDLQGVWSYEGGWSHDPAFWNVPTTLTLEDCATGERCGTIERIEQNRDTCVYELTYRSQEPDGFRFTTNSGGGAFGCGWSPWSNGTVHLTPGADDTIELVVGDSPPGFERITLDRVRG